MLLFFGMLLIVGAFIGLAIVIDPTEMDRRHAVYLEGYREGYRGVHPGFIIGPYPEAFKAGWEDGTARRTRDNIGR